MLTLLYVKFEILLTYANIWMTTSFNQEERFEPINLVQSHHCTNPGKEVIIYMSARGINFVSFHNLLNRF